MSLKEDPPEENNSDPENRFRSHQEALKGVSAGGDIIIGWIKQTVETTINILLPCKSQHYRFIQYVGVGVCITFILAGFIKLLTEGYASLSAKSLLITGSILLSLTCFYYVKFWEPDIPPPIDPPVEPLYSQQDSQFWPNPNAIDLEREEYRVLAARQKNREQYEKELPLRQKRQEQYQNECKKYQYKCKQYEQHEKRRNRVLRQVQRLKLLAAVCVFAVPLVTYAGYYSLTNYISSHTTLLTLADFYQEPDGGDGYSITGTIFTRLKNATDTEKDRTDITIQPLNKVIKQARQIDAQNEGKARLADMVVWGWYDQIPTIYSYFELLKAPPHFPKIGSSTGESRSILVQTPTLAELDHEMRTRIPKMRTRISSEMAYLTLFAVGLADYKNGDYQNAIARFDAALKQAEVFKKPVSKLDLSFVYFWRASARFYNAPNSNSGVEVDYDPAIEDFTKAIKLNPEYALAPDGWNNAYAEHRNHSLILASYKISQRDSSLDETDDDQERVCTNQNRDAYIITSDSPSKLKAYLAKIYNNRGITYAMQGDNDKALADYAKALSLDSDIDEVCNNLGIAYTEEGKYEPAIKNFDRAISVNPEDALAYNNRGNAYVYQNNYGQAIEDYNKAIELNSNLAEAYYNRGVAYLLQEEYKKAIKDFNKAIELKPDFAEVYLAEVYYHLGIATSHDQEYCKQAIKYFSRTIELKPDYADAYYARGGCLLIMDDNAQAYRDSNRVIQLNPDDAKGYTLRGISFFRQGDYNQAFNDFNRAIQLNPDLDLAYFFRGIAYSDRGDEFNAQKDFQRVITLTKNPGLRQLAEQKLQEQQPKPEPQTPSGESNPIHPSSQPTVTPLPNKPPSFTTPKPSKRVIPRQRKKEKL